MLAHLVNPELLKMAIELYTEKEAFVPGGDPSGGGGAPPGAGGPPPGAGAPPGGAPASPPPGGAPGGAPAGPPAGGDPSAGGGGGSDPFGMLMQKIQGLEAKINQGGGAGGAGGAGASGAAIKPKVDINVETMRQNNLLAKIVDHLGIPVPAQDMIATPEKLQAMASGQPTTSQAPAGGAGGGAIPPIGGIDPMQGSGAPGAQKQGFAVDANFSTQGLSAIGSRVDAVRMILQKRQG